MKASPGTGLRVFGRDDWQHCVYGADVKLAGDRTAGIVFGYADESNYEAFLATASAMRHVRVEEGNETVAHECPMRLVSGTWRRLKVDRTRGLARFCVNGALVFASPVHEDLCGRVGLRANGSPGAAFANLVVWFREGREPIAFRGRLSTGTLTDWWQNEPGSYQHIGRFFGDARVEVSLPRGKPVDGTEIALLGEGEGAGTSYCLALSRTEEQLGIALFLRGEQVAGASVPRAETGRVSLTCGDGLAAVHVDGDPVLRHRITEPTAAQRVVLRPSGNLERWQVLLAADRGARADLARTRRWSR